MMLSWVLYRIQNPVSSVTYQRTRPRPVPRPPNAPEMPSAWRTATAMPPIWVPGAMNWTVSSAGRPIPRKQPSVKTQP